MCSTVKTKVVCADNSDIFHWDLIASRTQHTTQWLNIHSLLLDILTHIHQYPGNIQMIGKWNINIIIWTFHSMVDMCGSNTFLKVLEIWVAAHRSMHTMDETLFAYVIDPSDVFFSFTLSFSLLIINSAYQINKNIVSLPLLRALGKKIASANKMTNINILIQQITHQ